MRVLRVVISLAVLPAEETSSVMPASQWHMPSVVGGGSRWNGGNVMPRSAAKRVHATWLCGAYHVDIAVSA